MELNSRYSSRIVTRRLSKRLTTVTPLKHLINKLMSPHRSLPIRILLPLSLRKSLIDPAYILRWMLKCTQFGFLQRHFLCSALTGFAVLDFDARVFNIEAAARICDEDVACAAVDHPAATGFAGEGGTSAEVVRQ